MQINRVFVKDYGESTIGIKIFENSIQYSIGHFEENDFDVDIDIAGEAVYADDIPNIEKVRIVDNDNNIVGDGLEDYLYNYFEHITGREVFLTLHKEGSFILSFGVVFEIGFDLEKEVKKIAKLDLKDLF